MTVIDDAPRAGRLAPAAIADQMRGDGGRYTDAANPSDARPSSGSPASNLQRNSAGIGHRAERPSAAVAVGFDAASSSTIRASHTSSSVGAVGSGSASRDGTSGSVGEKSLMGVRVQRARMSASTQR